nr:hypothetical protein [Bifidobacterium gallicum]
MTVNPCNAEMKPGITYPASGASRKSSGLIPVNNVDDHGGGFSGWMS